MELTALAEVATVISTAILLATINTWFVDFLVAPVKKWKPDVNFWWLPYVALATGVLAGWFGGVNLMEAYLDNVILGRIITGIAIGGGAKQIHEWFDPSTKTTRII